MRPLTTIAIVAAAAAMATAAFAETAPRLSDSQFIKANRCRGLIGSPALGGGDVTALDALLKAQKQGRSDYIRNKADEARSDAERSARGAGDQGKASLSVERDSCKAFAS